MSCEWDRDGRMGVLFTYVGMHDLSNKMGAVGINSQVGRNNANG
jgi:hypothetical protein